jgi:hypothetical protein
MLENEDLMQKNIFKILLSLMLFAFVSDNLHSQGLNFLAPDYDRIKKIVTAKTSVYYYPELIKRYRKNDTTLKKDEYRLLYYGFFFYKLYKLDAKNEYSDSLNMIFKKTQYTDEDIKKVIELENIVLEQYPFNLGDLVYLSNSYKRLGDSVLYKKTEYKIRMIMETILSSGDGKSEETAWHVLAVSHEYDLLRIMGFKGIGHQAITKKGFDYLEVAENQYKIKGFHFNINMVLQKMNGLFEKSTNIKDIIK